MLSSLVGFGGCCLFLFFGLFFFGFAWATVYRFAREYERPRRFRWLVRWTIQGVLVPWLIWGLMNIGLSFELQPFIPYLQVARGTALWLPLYLTYVGGGFCLICSYWCALTLAWVISRAHIGLKGEAREHYRGLCVISLGALALPTIGLLWLGGWYTVGLAISALLIPIAGYAPSILRPRIMPPMYAKAIARMKFGKYSEAEEEVIKQLERRDDDFEGWLMLADLYATKFNDVGEAEQTILEVCDQPRTTPGQVSVAFHKLADWHLNISGDPDAARRALGVICNRMPGTHLARMAELRARQIPNSPEELHEQKINKPVYLPALHDPLDEERTVLTTPTHVKEAIERAAQLDKRLDADPADIVSREELARLCAGTLAKPEVAIAHVEKLLALPNQSPEKRAGWLGLIATWQIEGLHERELGRETLRQLIREFPKTSTAFAAQRRLLHLDMEDKMLQARVEKPTPHFRIEMDPENPGTPL